MAMHSSSFAWCTFTLDGTLAGSPPAHLPGRPGGSVQTPQKRDKGLSTWSRFLECPEEARMKAWLLAGVVLAVVAVSPVAMSAEVDACDPAPYHRCGAYDRERVTFCFVVQGGRMVDPTESDVITLGSDEIVEQGTKDNGVLYLRPGPAEDFIADIMNAPLPKGTLWVEKNSVAGLQTVPLRCGELVWFAECGDGQWMGPYGVSDPPLSPDLALA